MSVFPEDVVIIIWKLIYDKIKYNIMYKGVRQFGA